MTLLRTLPESNEPFSSTAVSSSSPHVWTLSALHFQEWGCHHWKWALKIQCPLIVVWSFSSVQISGTPGGPPTSSRTVTRGEYVEGHFRASSGKDDDILDSTFSKRSKDDFSPKTNTMVCGKCHWEGRGKQSFEWWRNLYSSGKGFKGYFG